MLNKKIKITLAAVSAAIVFILAAVIVINSFRLSSFKNLIEKQNSLILKETAENRETSDYLNNINSMLAYDLNRTRASLGLPLVDYPIKDITNGPENELLDEKRDEELQDAVIALLEAENINKKSGTIGKFIRNELISEYFISEDIKCEKKSNTLFELEYLNRVFTSINAFSESEILLTGIDGQDLTVAAASREAVYFINQNLEKLKILNVAIDDTYKKLENLSKSDELIEAAGSSGVINISDRKITVGNRINSNTISGIFEERGDSILYRINPGNQEYTEFESFREHLIISAAKMDKRKPDLILLDKIKEDFQKRLDDEFFIQYLNSMDLKINNQPREDIDYYYYDLNHSDGTRLGSFSILKKLGEIYLVDADEVPVSSLKTLSVKKILDRENRRNFIIPENIPKIEGLYSKDDSITFLLVGNHEKNTDTMILAHADKTSGKAHLIGIPRDLYWKGRKINSIYLNYGAEQFKNELSEITGLDIKNFIIVDMYAFIDIVNILGGIEVTLEEDLVDPTYRTRENGEWSTLNYTKGTYNLNGVEALRVARSRHGSNDFERSKRQQQILEAFYQKIINLKVTDANKVYAMLQVLFDYIDTDFSFIEILSIFNEYSDIDISGKHVLSFDNILYDTYSNIYMLEDQDIEFDEDFNKGAWILLPRDNDWNNIRWYIRGIINGEIQ